MNLLKRRNLLNLPPCIAPIKIKQIETNNGNRNGSGKHIIKENEFL